MRLIQELLTLTESSGVEQHLRSVMRGMEANLPHEARYKEWNFNIPDKQLWWVTQENTDFDYVANTIAEFLEEEGFEGWTVNVACRDDWDGGWRDHSASWEKAHTGSGHHEPAVKAEPQAPTRRPDGRKEYEPDKFVDGDDMMKAIRDFS